MKNFNNDFDTRMGKIKVLFVIILIITLLSTAGRFLLAGNLKSKNGVVYSITVTNYHGSSTNIASEIITQDGHCVTFNNEFGLLQTECGDYISVVQF